MPYGLVVRFTARDAAAAAAFDRLAAETLEEIKADEPGTLVYVNHMPVGESATRVFYELYEDRDAFLRHEEQPHVKRFLAEREQYLTNTEVTFLDEMAGKRPTSSQER
ncbi:antibiotic biosynthesis monooxygenase [Streptomyces sp. HNM0663]|uniref:Antibiotic biosynthesis monooxygenase n=1 Tax=Streptomyces chengmaiensis TaxID=3040919 RepID=A0ABT6HXH4_9ACTN|nr:antibiotic biosynthesis monooxygenase [Streptomyces chengmaiensis]MDH2393390.1 antibiotic biosynthesis monooxygenase [Streptomyces chengmaiensis]